MPLAELMQFSLHACEGGAPYPYLWRDHRGKRLAMERDAKEADQATRERWAVNYDRHRLTTYDREVEAVIGQEDATEAIMPSRPMLQATLNSTSPMSPTRTQPEKCHRLKQSTPIICPTLSSKSHRRR
jgi:hypothetical protein